MDRLRVTLWTLTAAGAFALSWGSSGPAPTATAPGVLATVNGTRLTEADLALRLRPDHQQAQAQPQAAPPPEQRQKVLETLIAEELAAQRAQQLGLDADAEYLAGLAPLQAQVDGYKRKALNALLAKHEVQHEGQVSEAEARQFYVQHEPKLKKQVQIWQILRRSPEAIEQARAELAAAPSFEAYARTQFPAGLTDTERPWDLGYLRWEQLPEAWREVVYSMKKGEVSPVIHGQKDRYWILMLADVRDTPEVTFEAVRPTLTEALKGQKVAQLQQRKVGELRARAKVVYAEPR